MKAKNKIHELLAKMEDNLKYDEKREIYLTKKQSGPIYQGFMETHGTEMMPDDWRFQKIAHMLSHFQDYELNNIDDIREIVNEVVDGLVDIYTSDLTKWLASRLQRIEYVDEAIKNYGKGESVVNDLMAGQYFEIEEMAGRLITWVEENLGE